MSAEMMLFWGEVVVFLLLKSADCNVPVRYYSRIDGMLRPA